MAENNEVIANSITWQSEGTDKVLADMNMLRDVNEKTTKAIHDTDTAVGSLNAGLQQTDFAPLSAGASDYWGKVKQDADDAKNKLDKTGDKMLDAGKASMMLENALDGLVPGLGNVFESITSMNPVAVTATAVLTGVALVFGDMQQKAEAAKKAIEAATKAEAERAVSQLDVQQKLNRALEGDKTARDSLLKDYAAAVDERRALEVKSMEFIRQRSDAEEELLKIDEKVRSTSLLDLGTLNALALEEEKLIAKRDEAQKQLDAMGDTIAQSTTTMTDLNDALQQLNVTDEERAAIQLAVTQGAEGANTALDNLTKGMEGLKDAFVDVAQNTVKTFQDIGNNIASGIQKAAEDALKAREEAEKRLIDINEELIETEEDYGKTLAERVIEEQRAKEIGALEDKLAAAKEYDAAREKNAKIAELTEQGHAADIAAQQKHMADQQKLLAAYIKTEQNATEDHSRDRIRKLEDLYNTLEGLASQRDVAGFVNARAAGLTGIARGDEDAGVASTRRREAFEAQQAELVASFNKETETRANQLNQRLEQERAAGQQQVKQADIVQKQIADLRQRYAEQDLRARQMNEDATYRQTIDILQRKRMDELKITAGAAAGVIDFINQMAQAAARLRGFAGEMSVRGGTTSGSTGQQYIRPGIGQQPPNVTVNASVGEHVSQNDLKNFVDTVTGVFRGFAGVG